MVLRQIQEKVPTPAGIGSRDRRMKNVPEPELIRAGLSECQRITKKHGTSFYFATQFFPYEVRQAIYAIYAFARIPDEIVDDPDKADPGDAVLRLEKWRQRWLRATHLESSDDPVMAAIIFIFKKYGISVEIGEAFLRSMFMDMEKETYENYEELEDYMYGSAAVIGLMVTRVVGYSSEAAFPYAEKLGYAFQLTNFLRDIREDVEDLGRIYMPKDELAASGLTTEDIEQKVYDERFVTFMKSQIERNREVYRDAQPGIKMLKWRGRLAVKTSYVLYQGILDEIERVDYNVYLGRVRTSFSRKLWLTLKVMFGKYE